MSALGDLVWNGRDDADYRRARVRHALMESELAKARVQGMKARAEQSPATAAKGGFPYPARTCAEWVHVEDRGRYPVKRRGRP